MSKIFTPIFWQLKMLHFDETPVRIGYVVTELWSIYHLNYFFANISKTISATSRLIPLDHVTLLCLSWRTTVTSAHLPQEGSSYRMCNFSVFSHVQKGIPGLAWHSKDALWSIYPWLYSVTLSTFSKCSPIFNSCCIKLTNYCALRAYLVKMGQSTVL